MKFLILGGARQSLFSTYVQLRSADHEIIVVDNLLKESFAGVSKDVKFIFSDALDEVLLSRIIKDNAPDMVIWNIDCGLPGQEQESDPRFKSLQVRHLGLLRALNACVEFKVRKFGYVRKAIDAKYEKQRQEIFNEVQLATNSELKIKESNSLEDLCKSILI